MTERGWPKVRIGELGHVVTGRTPPTAQSSYFGRDYPFICPGDMHQGKYARETQRHLSKEGAELLHRIMIPKNSVCVSCIGWQMGEVVMTVEPSFTNQQINTIVPNRGVDPSYLYYSLRPKKMELLSLGSAAGVRTPILNKSAFCELEITLPPLTIQRLIASILSAYDALIDVNTRRVTVLEEMVQCVFNDICARTVGVSGSALTLGRILDSLESGSRPKGGVRDKGTIPSIGAENIVGLGQYNYSKDKFIDRSFFLNMRRGHIRHGDVMIYKDGANIGRLSLAWNGFPHQTCAVNEHVFLLRPIRGVPSHYLYFWLNQPELQTKIRDLNSNSAQPGINQQGVNSLPVWLPPASVLENFDASTKPTIDLLFTCAQEITVLRAARDLLLPKLISGEVDLERTVALREAAE